MTKPLLDRIAKSKELKEKYESLLIEAREHGIGTFDYYTTVIYERLKTETNNLRIQLCEEIGQ